ncbi:MAG: PAS domain S-box protein [bacterium]
MADSPLLGIVEDESLVAEDLKMLLNDLGYEVSFRVSSGEECLESVDEHDVDIVLMDINLGDGMDGIETARKLREVNIPAVFITAYSDEKTVNRARETDPLGYLSKPVNETDLRTTLAVASRKQEMEEKLRESERRYRELVEASPDIVFRVNSDQEFTFLSNNIRQLGYTPDELEGKNFTDLLHPDDVSQVAREKVLPQFEGTETGDELSPDLFDERRTGDRATYNLEISLRVGSEQAKESFGTEYPTFEVNSAGLFRENGSGDSKTFAGTIGTIRNIMDRKEAEQELRLKERAMSSTQEGITISKNDGDDNPLIYVNEGFVEMTGYSRAWALGRDCRFLQGEKTDPDKVARMREAINKNEPISLEVINYRQGGEPFWNKVSITPIRDEQGSVTHYVGIQQDITEKKNREEELRQAEKLAAIGEMSAGLMHEINNPNAFIQGNIEYLRKAWGKIKEALPESARESDALQSVLEELPRTLDEMRSGTNRIEEIVNNVKLFARRERSDQEKKHFDPIPVVKEALATLGSFSEDYLEARLESDEGEGQIQGDPTEITQIVTNLVKNAIDAVREDESSDGNVELEASFDPEEFIIKVQDDGPGIPQDVRSKIFDPFYTTKPTGKGTGLGLSIVNGIVDRLDGRINVNSSEGVGTRFEVILPRSD